MANLKELLVSNPNLKISDVDKSTFKNHQKFGGVKASLTVNRNFINSYLKLNKRGLKTLAVELGVSEYLLEKYVTKQPISLQKSKLIVKALDSDKLRTIKSATKVKKPKVNKVRVTKVKEDFNGDNKKTIRDVFINHIKLNSGKFFTLPSHSCEFEKQLNITKENKFHYVACENKRSIFERLQQTVSNSKLFMSTIYGDAGETLNKATENEYSNIFADYCGTFPTFDKEVRNIFFNNIVKVGGLVGLTFSQREANTKEQPSKTFNKKVNDVVNSDVIENVNDGIKIKLLAYIGNDYKLIEYISYRDGQAMIFALLKRVK